MKNLPSNTEFVFLNAHKNNLENKVRVYIDIENTEFISLAQVFEFFYEQIQDIKEPCFYASRYLTFDKLTCNQIELLSLIPNVTKIECYKTEHPIYRA